MATKAQVLVANSLKQLPMATWQPILWSPAYKHTHFGHFHILNSTGPLIQPSCTHSSLRGPQTNKLSLVLNKAMGSAGFKYILALLPYWFQCTSGSSVWSRAAAHMVPPGLG